MSGSTKLAEPIEGYRIHIVNKRQQMAGANVHTIPLKLNKAGGAHITNPEDLIQMIEDAVFHEEDER